MALLKHDADSARRRVGDVYGIMAEEREALLSAHRVLKDQVANLQTELRRTVDEGGQRIAESERFSKVSTWNNNTHIIIIVNISFL